MNQRWTRAAALAVLVAALASISTLAAGAQAATVARSVTAAGSVAGTVETRLVINRFSAVGSKLVGRGMLTSTYRNASGAVLSQAAKPTSLTVATASGPGPCKVLYLELDELDLQMLG